MLSLLLVPLDGSPVGEMALPTAARLARAHGAAVRLVSVDDAAAAAAAVGAVAAVPGVPAAPLAALPPGELAALPDPALLARRRDATTAYLARQAEHLAAACGCTVTSGVVDGSAVSEAIAGEAERCGAGLIVLTTHGRGGFSRLWLGSVTGDLLRVAPVPLLVVHAREDTDPSTPVDPSHVLLPVDDDDPDDPTIDAALEVVRPFGARVTVLRVVRTGDSLLPYDQTFWTAAEQEAAGRRQAAAEREVAAVVGRVRERGVEAVGLVVLEPDPARAILRVAAERDATLVAMRAHARRTAARRFLGGTTDKVLRGAEVPVLVVRPA